MQKLLRHVSLTLYRVVSALPRSTSPLARHAQITHFVALLCCQLNNGRYRRCRGCNSRAAAGPRYAEDRAIFDRYRVVFVADFQAWMGWVSWATTLLRVTIKGRKLLED